MPTPAAARPQGFAQLPVELLRLIFSRAGDSEECNISVKDRSVAVQYLRCCNPHTNAQSIEAI